MNLTKNATLLNYKSSLENITISALISKIWFWYLQVTFSMKITFHLTKNHLTILGLAKWHMHTYINNYSFKKIFNMLWSDVNSNIILYLINGSNTSHCILSLSMFTYKRVMFKVFFHSSLYSFIFLFSLLTNIYSFYLLSFHWKGIIISYSIFLHQFLLAPVLLHTVPNTQSFTFPKIHSPSISYLEKRKVLKRQQSGQNKFL